MTDPLSTGTASLDELIGGVRIGDNLVIQSHGGAGLHQILDSYVGARKSRRLVACTAGEPWPGELPDDVTVIDLPNEPPAASARARDIVVALDEAAGTDALFAFWSLTSMQNAWGSDDALEFFSWACPRLYRRGSVALWPMDPDLHRPKFLRRLTEITQVVVDLRPGSDEDTLIGEVLKADGRPRVTVGRRVALRADSLSRIEERASVGPSIGDQVQKARADRGLGQAELARLVDISPSALSQLERGARSVSADTITRIWEVLGVPFGPDPTADLEYMISRRGAQPAPESARGFTRRRLVADPAIGASWLVTMQAGASGRDTPFSVKSAEAITVLSGIVDLDLSGRPETLHEGDTLLTKGASVTGWANPSPVENRLHWTILPT